MRRTLAQHAYNWEALLTAAQLDAELWPDGWGGHETLRSWLADGAYTPDGAAYASTRVWPLVRA